MVTRHLRVIGLLCYSSEVWFTSRNYVSPPASFVFIFGLSIYVPALNKQHCTFSSLIIETQNQTFDVPT